MDAVKSEGGAVDDVERRIEASVGQAPQDEIVISGMAGVFPKCANVLDFGEKLLAKEDLISETDHFYSSGETELRYKYGKLGCDLNKFDAEYFKIIDRLADAMDPMGRVLLEKTYEAIVDAGYNPLSFRGSKTGVYVGSYNSESEMVWVFENKTANPFGFLGSSRFMLANRISFWLGTRGPSYNVDTACSSSFFALVNAYEDIRRSICDAAIVAGCQLCLAAVMQETIFDMGMFSPDGAPKCFDEAADGYCRAETVGVILLEKFKNAKRVYARLIHAKLNSNGNTTQNLWNTSVDGQQTLFREFYDECGIDAGTVEYVEAHSTGTREGDAVEVSAIENVFCVEGRKRPLKIGSVKSNMGHSEAGSGMSAIAKLILGYEKGVMLPNIRFVKPRTDIKPLHEGRIVVVTEPIQWESDLAAINNFGLGGTNAHALFRSNPKLKKNGGIPEDDLPRLAVISGRTEEAVDSFLDFLANNPIDGEFIRLLHEIHRSNFSGHKHRGYILLRKQGQYSRHSTKYKEEERPVWFVFSGMGSQWPTMGRELMALPVFAESIAKCGAVLKREGVDLEAILSSSDPSIFDDVTNSFLGIAAIQVALVDVLSAIGVKADGMLGHSIGELGCAYADGCLTAEQTVLTAYYRGKALSQTNFIRGSMASIGLGYNQILETLPAEFDVACHNSSDNCTVSAPAEEMQKFVDRLESDGIFVRTVNVSNVPFHSRYIASAGPKFLVELKKLIPQKQPRSVKWISTSNLEKDWEAEAVKYSCPEYYANNLLNPVYFDEACRHIPSNAIAIEIGPHGILQPILKRSLDKNVANVALMSRNHADSTEFLLCALGKIFEAGLSLELHQLYPKVEFPVSKGTPMIGPLIKWDHNKDYFVQKKMLSRYLCGERDVTVTLADSECLYLRGHIIDNRNLYPAAGYLVLVWDTLARINQKIFKKVSVVFENVKFLRATVIPAQGEINFAVMVHKGTGNFEVCEKGVPVAIGRVALLDEQEERAAPADGQEEIATPDSSELPLNRVDIYKEFRLRGYYYSGLFQGISRASLDGSVGIIKWAKNFVPFLDSLFQLTLLQGDTRSLFIPVELQKLSIDVGAHFDQLSRLSEENPEFTAYVRKDCKTIRCGGVRVENLKATCVARKKLQLEPTIEKICFCPFVSTERSHNRTQIIAIFGQFILHNCEMRALDVLELLDDSSDRDETLVSTILREGFERASTSQNTLLITKSSDDPRINEETSKLADVSEQIPRDRSFFVLIAPKIFGKKKDFEECIDVIDKDGFLLTTDEIGTHFSAPDGLTLCCEYSTENERILLFRKSGKEETKINYATVRISSESFSWIAELQNLLRAEASDNEKIVIYSQNENLSGILGFVNCLSKEIGLARIRCFFVADKSAPAFCVRDPFYRIQLGKRFSINVYKDGVWGDYGHFSMDAVQDVRATHAFVNTLVNGDLSTLRWIEGPIDPQTYEANANRKLVRVHYSSLNFRDIMLATGKLSSSVVFKTRLEQEIILGLEYSGRSLDGNRCMGICGSKAMSSIVDGDENLMWPVPKSWSLEDAATVPVVYATVLYALIFCGRIKRGESILIHAGSGGVGQAAINICTYFKCEIFTTVGTEQKRHFIRETFPHIPDSHIGDSRSTSFEYMVMKETNGKGVDLVLNSLAEEKLQASVRCLAHRGRFLEIGLFDLAMNNSLGMGHFLKEISFQGVELANLIDAEVETKKLLQDKLQEFIDNGSVKPLTRTVFAAPDIEQAFRFMATGKHIGKVLLKIRNEESDNSLTEPEKFYLDAVPRYNASKHKSYVICGGLGGLGLELIDWLLLRGGRKFVIVSRNGVRTGYQAWKIRHWKSYGATVTITTDDATKLEGVKMILEKAVALGPVAAIFNLAVILDDALFDNQSEESFAKCCGPKSQASYHLDQLSRKMCPNLEHFVLFSSISCGLGNAGQTNYGYANSIMERICEDRRSHNLPALAIQWGLLGEVGLAVKESDDEKPFVFSHIQEQPIVSYLQVLDILLKQSNTIVASKVRAEKHSKTKKTNVAEAVASILGIKDMQKVDPNMPLVDYGIDSLTSVEIKQVIEMELNIFLTYQDIKTATFAKLYELQAANGKKQKKNIIESQHIVNPKISELRAELLDPKSKPSIV